MLKSLADGQKSKEATVVPLKKEDQFVPDESDSTKSRRLAEDYDSTKNGMDYGKYQGTHTCHHALLFQHPAVICKGAASLAARHRDSSLLV